MQSIKTKKHFSPWFMWAAVSAFFFSEYFARVAPSVMVDPLMQTFGVGAAKLGLLSAVFYYAYILMQLPVGSLVDHFNLRKLLAFTSMLCALSCLLFSYTNLFSFALFSRFVMGLTAAFAFVGSLKIATLWFDQSIFATLMGSTQALGMLGAAVGEGPVSVLVEHLGWRVSMQLIALFLFLVSVCIYVFVRDKKPVMSVLAHSNASKNIILGLKKAFSHPMIIINACFAGCLYAPTAAFAELWGPNYLQQVYHISPSLASSAVSVVFIGWAIGSPLVGMFSDYIKNRKWVMFSSAMFSLVFLTIILYSPHLSVWQVFVLLFCYGMSNVGVATAYAMAAEFSDHSFSGVAMALTNMVSVLIGALFQPIIGKILDLNWSGTLLNGLRIYSAKNYHHAMLSLPIVLLLASVLALFLKDSYGQS